MHKLAIAATVAATLTAGGIVIEVPAAKSSITVTGSVIGPITPDAKKTRTFTLTLKGEKGKQSITKFEGGAEEVLSAKQGEGAAEGASETTTEALTASAETELMES